MSAKQTIYLAVTPKGEKYFDQMVATGYVNLPTTQSVEWNILHDLTLQGPTRMDTFLTEGRSTILGRKFEFFSGRVHGQLAIEGYGKTLHSLITQGYVRAYRKESDQ